MKIVEYERSLQWVGDLRCPACQGLTPAWRSSGMSESFPHFFCTSCSNVILRQADKDLVWEAATPALLAQIAATLPACQCGGHFAPGAGPKCCHCHTQIPVVADAVQYLHSPHMILVHGAILYHEDGPAYQVRIVE